jgi:hypothetical protein
MVASDQTLHFDFGLPFHPQRDEVAIAPIGSGTGGGNPTRACFECSLGID